MKRLLPALLASTALALVPLVTARAQTIQKAGATSIGKCAVNGAVKPCVLIGTTLVPLPVTASDLTSGTLPHAQLPPLALADVTSALGYTPCNLAGCTFSGYFGSTYNSNGIAPAATSSPSYAVATNYSSGNAEVDLWNLYKGAVLGFYLRGFNASGTVVDASLQVGSFTATGAATAASFVTSGSLTASTDVFIGALVASVATQGSYIGWNRGGGDGGTWIVNQKGGGGGGTHIGEANSSNTYTESLFVAPAGSTSNLYSSLAVTAPGTSGATAQQTIVGYNASTDVGTIQAAHQGTGYTPLQLNPGGGAVSVGPGGLTLPSFTLGTAQTAVRQLGQITSPYTTGMLNTQNDILRVQVGACTPAYELGAAQGSTAGITSCIATPTGTYNGSDPSWPDAAGAFYSINNNATKSSLSLYALSGIGANNSVMTATNFSSVNCTLFVSCAPGSGFDFSYGYVLENDLNIYSKSGGVAPAGNAAGFFANLHADVQNQGQLAGFLVGVADATGTGTPKRWKFGIAINPGAADVAFSAAPLTITGPTNSQPINLTSFGSSNTPYLSSIFNDSAGNLNLLSTAGSGVTFSLGGGVSGAALSSGATSTQWNVKTSTTANSVLSATVVDGSYAQISIGAGLANGLKIVAPIIAFNGSLYVGATPTANCPAGAPSSNFTVVNGFVTHC